MVSAASGHEAEGIRYDHSRKKTVAAWQYVPKADWGLVAKIDLAEVDGYIWWLRICVMLAGLLTLLFFCVTGYRYSWFHSARATTKR